MEPIVEIRETENAGRGVFALKDIDPGTLLFVEPSLVEAWASHPSDTGLFLPCTQHYETDPYFADLMDILCPNGIDFDAIYECILMTEYPSDARAVIDFTQQFPAVDRQNLNMMTFKQQDRQSYTQNLAGLYHSSRVTSRTSTAAYPSSSSSSSSSSFSFASSASLQDLEREFVGSMPPPAYPFAYSIRPNAPNQPVPVAPHLPPHGAAAPSAPSATSLTASSTAAYAQSYLPHTPVLPLVRHSHRPLARALAQWQRSQTHTQTHTQAHTQSHITHTTHTTHAVHAANTHTPAPGTHVHAFHAHTPAAVGTTRPTPTATAGANAGGDGSDGGHAAACHDNGDAVAWGRLSRREAARLYYAVMCNAFQLGSPYHIQHAQHTPPPHSSPSHHSSPSLSPYLSGLVGKGLFPLAAMFNHHCAPNAAWSLVHPCALTCTCTGTDTSIGIGRAGGGENNDSDGGGAGGADVRAEAVETGVQRACVFGSSSCIACELRTVSTARVRVHEELGGREDAGISGGNTGSSEDGVDACVDAWGLELVRRRAARQLRRVLQRVGANNSCSRDGDEGDDIVYDGVCGGVYADGAASVVLARWPHDRALTHTGMHAQILTSTSTCTSSPSSSLSPSPPQPSSRALPLPPTTPPVCRSSLRPSLLQVRALRRVRAGEQLCIAYTDHTAARAERVQALERGYGFLCGCSRCVNEGSEERKAPGKGEAAEVEVGAAHTENSVSSGGSGSDKKSSGGGDGGNDVNGATVSAGAAECGSTCTSLPAATASWRAWEQRCVPTDPPGHLSSLSSTQTLSSQSFTSTSAFASASATNSGSLFPHAHSEGCACTACSLARALPLALAPAAAQLRMWSVLQRADALKAALRVEAAGTSVDAGLVAAAYARIGRGVTAECAGDSAASHRTDAAGVAGGAWWRGWCYCHVATSPSLASLPSSSASASPLTLVTLVAASLLSPPHTHQHALAPSTSSSSPSLCAHLDAGLAALDTATAKAQRALQQCKDELVAAIGHPDAIKASTSHAVVATAVAPSAASSSSAPGNLTTATHASTSKDAAVIVEKRADTADAAPCPSSSDAGSLDVVALAPQYPPALRLRCLRRTYAPADVVWAAVAQDLCHSLQTALLEAQQALIAVGGGTSDTSSQGVWTVQGLFPLPRLLSALLPTAAHGCAPITSDILAVETVITDGAPRTPAAQCIAAAVCCHRALPSHVLRSLSVWCERALSLARRAVICTWLHVQAEEALWRVLGHDVPSPCLPHASTHAHAGARTVSDVTVSQGPTVPAPTHVPSSVYSTALALSSAHSRVLALLALLPQLPRLADDNAFLRVCIGDLRAWLAAESASSAADGLGAVVSESEDAQFAAATFTSVPNATFTLPLPVYARFPPSAQHAKALLWSLLWPCWRPALLNHSMHWRAAVMRLVPLLLNTLERAAVHSAVCAAALAAEGHSKPLPQWLRLCALLSPLCAEDIHSAGLNSIADAALTQARVLYSNAFGWHEELFQNLCSQAYGFAYR